MPLCTVERKRPGSAARSSAVWAPCRPARAIALSRGPARRDDRQLGHGEQAVEDHQQQDDDHVPPGKGASGGEGGIGVRAFLAAKAPRSTIKSSRRERTFSRRVPEEVAQHLASFAFADPGIDFGRVVAGRLGEQAGAVEDGAALGIGRAEIEPARSAPARSRRRTSRRAPASPTGRSRRAGSRRAPPRRRASRPSRHGRWDRCRRASGCAPTREHLAAARHHRADRHLAVLRRGARLVEREAHRLGKRKGALLRRWPGRCVTGDARHVDLPVSVRTTGTWTLVVVVPTSTDLGSIETRAVGVAVEVDVAGPDQGDGDHDQRAR